MFLLIDEDGQITEIDELPSSISWDCWPRAIRIDLECGPDCYFYQLKESGWEEVKMAGKQ